MSILDAKLEFSDSQSLIASAASTVVSANTVDLGVDRPNIGEGEPVWCHVKVGESVSCASGPGTLTTTVQHSASDSGPFSTLIAGSAATFASSTSEENKLLAGVEILSQPLPRECNRYLRITYAIAASDITAGSVDAWLDLSAG